MWSYVSVYSWQVRFRFWVLYSSLMPKCRDYFLIFLAFDFCRFCVVIRFFIPATTANELRLQRIFYLRFYPLHFFSYLNYWVNAQVSWFFFIFISVRFLSVLRGHSVFHPRHNGQWAPTSKDFLSQILSITFIFLS